VFNKLSEIKIKLFGIIFLLFFSKIFLILHLKTFKLFKNTKMNIPKFLNNLIFLKFKSEQLHRSKKE
jgi:hypothetical protein